MEKTPVKLSIIIPITNGLDDGEIQKEVKKELMKRGIDAPFKFRKIGENFRGDVEFLRVVLKPKNPEPRIVVRKRGPTEYVPFWE